LALLCLGAGAAGAATIQFTLLPPYYQNGEYNGFAQATVDASPNQLLICDDFNHTTYMPSGKIEFYVSTLAGRNPLQYARFVDWHDWSGSVLKYEEAAVLLDGLTKAGSGLSPAGVADYQSALWHLFTPQAPLSSTGLTLLSQAVTTVESGGLDNDFYLRLRVYTPAAAYASNQEFLEWLPDPGGPNSMATPEPPTWGLLLIGAGLILMSCCSDWLRKRWAAYRSTTWGSSLRAPGR
jgi:hypothetical protein